MIQEESVLSDIAAAYVRDLQNRCGWESYVKERFTKLQPLLDRYSLPSLTDEDVRTPGSVKDVINGIELLGHKLQPIPLVAVLPTDDFNACATLAPDGYPIVFLEARLEALLLYLGAAFGKLILVERDFQTACYMILMTSLDAAYPDLSDVIQDFLNPDRLPKDFPSFDYIVKLTSGLERFVIAHEFAHHILRHLNDTRTLSVKGRDDTVLLRIFSRAQQEELDADALAYDIYIADMHSRHDGRTDLYDLLDALPLLFLKFLQIVCSIRGVESDSHPPPEARVVRLLRNIETVGRSKAMLWYAPIANTLDTVWPQFLEHLDRSGVREAEA